MTYSKTLHIDLETYSSADLIECGVYRYAEAEDFRILLFGYQYDGEDVQVLDLTKEELPGFILDDLVDEAVLKVAHNANFERVCLTRYIKDYAKQSLLGEKVLADHFTEDGFLPPEQWRDTMIMASEQGYPASLAQLGSALGLESDKQKMAVGKRLIQYFCKPCKPTKANGGRTRNLPEHDVEKWELFIEYNRRDVISESAIYDKLNTFCVPVSDSEWGNWYLDQRINDRGIQIDTDLVNKVREYNDKRSIELKDEAKRITGLENPQSVAQLKSWIEAQEGRHIESLNKSALKDLLKEDLLEETRRALEIRQELGKTSVKKYDAFARTACSDGRVRGAFQFYGGRTGRWAGRLIQPQNFPRPAFDDLGTAREIVKEAEWDVLEMLYSSANDVFATLIRTAIIPREGHRFAIADYSAIEARVIAWLTRTTWRQEVFKNGGDIYCASASQMFGVPVEKHGINGHLRQKGKIAELALGYGGGTAALEAFGASKMGISPEQQKDIVTKWRRASPRIKNFWYELGGAFEEAIYGGFTHLDRDIKVYKSNGNVYIKLPNGRSIAYVTPRIENGQVSYLGLNQTTRKWEWVKTWGGKLTENVVQSIARDCLCETLRGCEAIGAKTVMHVHDEVICEVPRGLTDQKFEKLLEVMAKPIAWAPDLLLVGDGFVSDYYKKD